MKNFFLVISLFVSLFSHHTYAGPADYIYTPTVEAGEREIDIKYGETAPVAGVRAKVGSIGMGYSPRENWFTEVYIKDERNGAENATLVESENRFQLTETGKYPVDVGTVVELEIPVSGTAPKEIKLGALFQTEFGKFQLNGNILFERALGQTDESGTPYTTNLNYQWQAKYRWKPLLEFGIQSFGAMGKWNDWSQQNQQSKQIGPAIFGKLRLDKQRAIKYNAAWLMAINSASPNHTFRTQIEYEFF